MPSARALIACATEPSSRLRPPGFDRYRGDLCAAAWRASGDAVSAGFTPGPWDFARGVNEYGREGGPILGTVTLGGTWHIAVLPSDLGPESEANARLIAAAPELEAEPGELVDQDIEYSGECIVIRCGSHNAAI
jgi:hypothetical protein